MILTRDGKEVIAIYKQNGDEVDEVKDANGRLVYTNTREITGTLPLSFTSRGKPLSDYRISGNAVQDGTPTPEAPVDVDGCGVRTWNLYDYRKSFATDVIAYNEYFTYYLLALQPNTTYTAYTNCESKRKPAYSTTTFIITPDEIAFNTANGGVYKNTPMTFTTQNSGLVKVGIRVSDDSGDAIPIYQENDFANGEQWLMLNVGSTALPYEPYGYKLPPTVNGIESPIYLGEAQTTRKIKKSVLTGGEDFAKNSTQSNDYLYYGAIGTILPGSISKTSVLCNELYETGNAPQKAIGINTKNTFGVIYFNFGADVMNAQSSGNTVSGLKEYLAAQYAAGTPVTVWYVLAEPEIGIVNEPLMKIGSYADTITMAQAGVTIPTVSGTNVLDMSSPVKPSEVYIKGKGIRAIT